MRRLTLLLLCAAACAGPARETRPPPPAPPPPQPAPQPRPVVREPPPPPQVTHSDDGIAAIDTRPQAEGRTMIEVLKPEGASIEIYDGDKSIANDAAPLSVEARSDHWYRVTAHLPSGALREKKIHGEAGKVTSLRFADSGVRDPVAMSTDEFRRLVNALNREPGDKAKISVLETAAARAWFTTAQAGAIIDHVVYRENKLLVVPILRGRILDKQNAYLLYQHFTWREDKAKVEAMLEH